MLPIQTIVFPTDFSTTADEALEVAKALARDHQAKLVLMHAVLSVPSVEVYVAQEELDKLKLESRGKLNALAAQIADSEVEVHVPFGDPGPSIVGVAQQVGADLIVMGTHGRTGLGRVLLGSVAEHVLRHATCPVLTIKPGTERHLQDRAVKTEMAGSPA